MFKKSLQTATTDRLLPSFASLMTRLSVCLTVLVCVVPLCSCSQIQGLYIKDSLQQSKENQKSTTLIANQQVNQPKGGQGQDTSIVGNKSRGKTEDSAGGQTICWGKKVYLPTFDALPTVSDHAAKVLELQILPSRPGEGANIVISIDAAGRVLLRRISAWSSPRLFATLPAALDLVAINLDHLLVATASGKDVRIYSLLNLESISLNRLESHVTSLDFSPTEPSLLMGGADGRVYRWNYCLPNRSVLGRGPERGVDRYIGHASVVSAVRYHPFGRFFFSGDWRGSFRAWLNYGADAADWQKDSGLSGHRFFTDRSTTLKIGRSDQERVARIVVTPNGRYVALAMYAGSIELWQVRGMRKVLEFQAHRGVILALAISPEGSAIASAGRDGRLKTWRISSEPGTLSSGSQYVAVEQESIEWPQVESMTFVDENRLMAADVVGRVQLLRLSEDL